MNKDRQAEHRLAFGVIPTDMQMTPTRERPAHRAAGRREEEHEGEKKYKPVEKFHVELQPGFFIAQGAVECQIKGSLRYGTAYFLDCCSFLFPERRPAAK